MKKIFSLAICILLVASVAVSLCACARDELDSERLVVYNCADYIYDTELKDFQAYYQQMTGKKIDITYVTYDTNETMLTKVLNGDSKVDVVCPSEYAIQKLLEHDYLVELNYFDQQKYVQSMQLAKDADYVHYADYVDKNVMDKVKATFDGINVNGKVVNMSNYIVPYMYGTLGILYNKYAFMEWGIYDEQILNDANWGILFNQKSNGSVLCEQLQGGILMKDSIRDSYAATVFYLLQRGALDGLTCQDKNNPHYGQYYTDLTINELINAVDEQLIELCKQALTEQKDQLFGYEVDFGKDDLLKGNAFVDLAWSGDAMYAVEESWNDELEDYELAYYVPHTAGNLWIDSWVVPKCYNKQHDTAVKLFINFMNKPEIAAKNMLEIGYTSAVNAQVIRNDQDARKVLASGYNVYAEGNLEDEDGNPLDVQDADFDSWDSFASYFFDNGDFDDAIDHSNWRYPFEIDESQHYDRSLSSLGVMRDFGVNNKLVVTMWNYARSAGISTLPLLAWTVALIALAVGVVVLVVKLKDLQRRKVKVSTDSK